jgi:molecular chaperone GrpE
MTTNPNDPAPADAALDDLVDEPVPEAPADDTVEPTASGQEAVGQDAAPGADDRPVGNDDFTPEQIDALVAERDEFLDAYRRTAADFENFRKLSQKRLADEVSRNQGSFVERLLPVLDAIDSARQQGSEHLEAVATVLHGFLEKEGLERVHPVDEPFDPNVAEAVVHEAGDHDQPVVTEVLRTGYLWRGRVIRPAMVKVSG